MAIITVVTNAHIGDPYPSQQHAGLHHAVCWPQQDVNRPKARFKPTLPKKSGVDGRASHVPNYLG